MNTSNLSNVWILLRFVAGASALFLFARAAVTGRKVIRHFDVARVTEGQLALERQQELAISLVRVGAWFQLANLLLTILLAERLSHAIRGAMCGYGVFGAVPGGFSALTLSIVVALFAGVVAEVIRLDDRVRSLELAKPLAHATLLLAALAAIDFTSTFRFLMKLDLDVVASCCSTAIDSTEGVAARFLEAPRLFSWAAAALVLVAIGGAYRAGGAPSLRPKLFASVATLVAAPFALGGVTLYVAPYVFEVSNHTCPFCLFSARGYFLGYPLFGSIFFATVWSGGAFASTLLALSRKDVANIVAPFVAVRFRRVAIALSCTLVLSVASIVRYQWITGGAHLLP